MFYLFLGIGEVDTLWGGPYISRIVSVYSVFCADIALPRNYNIKTDGFF